MGIDLREATDDDGAAILELLQASMGWVPDEQYARFFAWKHLESPFGRSPAWVAVDGRRIVGFRTFNRWEFARDGELVRAVRAVDTATHPDHQGRGIFSRLTRHALDALSHDGVAFVFNTPNENSRPGYLKMGWRLVQRLPVAAHPRSPASLLRLARARTAADKWSADCAAGVPVSDVLADHEAVTAVLGTAVSRPGVLRTHRTPRYLAWRYGFPPLKYRAIPAREGIAAGLLIFRLRRRGAALEAAVCEELMPDPDASRRHRLYRELLRTTRADHAVRLGPSHPRSGFLPVPGQGPTLVWRDVCETTPPPAEAWDLSLGDIELF